MRAGVSAAFAAGLLLVACSEPQGPPLTIANLVIPEPPAATGVAAGYLEFENHSDRPIRIVRVTSPDFASIEMHETVILDDVARMTRLESLLIAQHSTVTFGPGGKHLMLSGGSGAIAAGMPVVVEFHDDANGLLAVSTTVRSRDGLSDRDRE